MKSLVLGSNGQVGWELARLLQNTEVVALDYPEIDLTNHTQLRSVILEVKPRIIFNAAAYTAVDKAEKEPALAYAINSAAPRIMAETANSVGAGLVHYSTDYVYDGTKTESYVENDSPNPHSRYGLTKAEGDASISEISGEFAILRTSWVYGGRGSNFLLTMLRLGKERSELKIVDDQVGSPTWCRHLAQTSVRVAEQMIDGKFSSGIYHTTNSGFTSWFGFAGEIFRRREARTGIPSPKLIPIRTEEYPLPAPRPKNSRMANNKLARQLGSPLPAWQEALRDVFIELPDDMLR